MLGPAQQIVDRLVANGHVQVSRQAALDRELIPVEPDLDEYIRDDLLGFLLATDDTGRFFTEDGIKRIKELFVDVGIIPVIATDCIPIFGPGFGTIN